MRTFPQDCEVEMLRGVERPQPSLVRRTTKKRMEYLAQKIDDRRAKSLATGFLDDELRVLAELLDNFNIGRPKGSRAIPR